MHRGHPAPSFTRCQTGPCQHFRQHRVLAIDAGKVSVSILLNGRPFGHFVLGQTVEVDFVDADGECQHRQQKYYASFPIMPNATILNLTQHACSGLRRERDDLVPFSMG